MATQVRPTFYARSRNNLGTWSIANRHLNQRALGNSQRFRYCKGGRIYAQKRKNNQASFWRFARDVGIAAVLAAVAHSTLAHDDRDDKRLPQSTISARQHFFGIENVNPKNGAVRPDRVILSWTGVSGFAAAYNGHVVLMDAYIARDGGILMSGQPLNIWPSMKYVGSNPQELAALKPELVLVGHTHFDHTGDIPTVIRANPNIVIAGAAEHCADIKAEVPDVQFVCLSLFAAGEPIGTTVELPKHLLPYGLEVTAIKHPHSSSSPNPATDPPFGWPTTNCTARTEYPVPAGEPEAWPAPAIGPASGAISIMYQFRVHGRLNITWQDTAGYIKGTAVALAMQKLPPTDIRLSSIAVAGRSVFDYDNELLKPKLVIPLHHDACGYLLRKDFVDHFDSLPADKRPPQLWFFTDPGDYLRPLVFDPSSEEWNKKQRD
jgi:hypothetical protein